MPDAPSGAPAARLACPVRGCARPLEPGDRVLHCAAGHSFDRARSGYWNLLQPQDRRSPNPGDTKGAALARRRLFRRGMAQPLVEALHEILCAFALPPAAAVLDVGCGEGSVLGALAALAAQRGPESGLEAHGVDLSAPALDLAARAFRAATWVVANADRGLPYASSCFAAVLSIVARRPAAEVHRVLHPSGALVLAIPGAGDLAELRQAVLGASPPLAAAAAVAAELAPWFTLVETRQVVHRCELDRPGLDDLLLATYRGQRTSQQAKRGDLRDLRVTIAHEILVLRPRASGELAPPARSSGIVK